MTRLSNQPPRDIAGELRAEIKRLQDKARGTALAQLHRAIGGLEMSTRFAPSRLRKCPTDRRWLETWEQRAITEELAKRQPQIDRLERKLKRLYAQTPTDTGATK